MAAEMEKVALLVVLLLRQIRRRRKESRHTLIFYGNYMSKTIKWIKFNLIQMKAIEQYPFTRRRGVSNSIVVLDKIFKCLKWMHWKLSDLCSSVYLILLKPSSEILRQWALFLLFLFCFIFFSRCLHFIARCLSWFYHTGWPFFAFKESNHTGKPFRFVTITFL